MENSNSSQESHPNSLLLEDIFHTSIVKENASHFLSQNSENVFLYSICSVMALTVLIGTTGNLMVVLAVKTSKKLQTTSNVFIVNLSICDLLFVAIVLPFNIYTYIAEGWFLDLRLCKFVGFLGYTLTGTTIITITLISWNRYQFVVNQHLYSEIFSKHRICWMLVGSWSVPVICLMPAILEIWGEFGYVPMLVACNLFLNHESQSFKLFLLIVRAGLPCAIIIYHYGHIFLNTRASHRRVRSQMAETQATAFDMHKQKKEMHLTRMMSVIFAVFILSYFPCTITGIIDWNTVLSKNFHMICAGTVYAGSAVNPLIYGLMNRQFRQAYCKLLSCGTAVTIKKLHNISKKEKEANGKQRQSRRFSCPASMTVLHGSLSHGPKFRTVVQTPLLQDSGADESTWGSSEDPFGFTEEPSQSGNDFAETGVQNENKTKPALSHKNTTLTILEIPEEFV